MVGIGWLFPLVGHCGLAFLLIRSSGCILELCGLLFSPVMSQDHLDSLIVIVIVNAGVTAAITACTTNSGENYEDEE